VTEPDAKLPAESMEAAIARWQSIYGDKCGGKRMLYLSTPLNTGLRFVEWWDAEGRHMGQGNVEYNRAHDVAVRHPNALKAGAIAQQLCGDGDCTVVNPVDFVDPPGWNQPTFHEFWARVIRQFIDHVVFVDGWEFSQGCCREFAAAQEQGIPCTDQQDKPLTAAHGLELLRKARARLVDLQMDTVVHDSVIAGLTARHHA